MCRAHPRAEVFCTVQVTIIGRAEEDELLLLASDGLWDVLTNQEAVNLAQRCLKRARQRGASRQAAARVAASVLTRAAVDQGSSDNVTVVVVDLSRFASAQRDCTFIDWYPPVAGRAVSLCNALRGTREITLCLRSKVMKKC